MNVHFLPDRALRDARTNLDALIDRARRSPVFGSSIDFDAPVWDLAPVKPARPTAGSARQAKLYFTTHDNGTAKGIEGRTLLPAAFADFVKTMIVLREEVRPKAAKDHDRILRAARSLHDVMRDPDRDPINLLSADFVAACSDIRTRKTLRGKPTEPTTAYRLGQGLEEIATFINRYNIAKAGMSFFNPFPRVTYDSTQVDEEAREEQAKKMASMEEVGAVVEASLTIRQKGDERDLLLIAIVEWLVCAPVRINELLFTRADCRRTERSRNKTTGAEVEYLGYAHEGSKGAPDATKWIPSAMVDIADRALADVKRITEPYRDIARWMEAHPGRAYIAEPWRLMDPDTMLKSGEVAQAVGLSGSPSAIAWMKGRGIKRREAGDHRRYRLGDIEASILRDQPTLPRPNMKLSDCLFLIPRHFSGGRGSPKLHTIDFVDDQMIADFLGGRDVMPSIFKRLQIHDADGKPYVINSHAFRHFLNTLAQEGLLSQLDIARWSGRKDLRQNEAYDHTGGLHLGREMRKTFEAGGMQGSLVEVVAGLPPIDRDAFLKGRFATAHFTSLGVCVQDFSLAPCPSYSACAGCSEHLVVKGKPEHRAEAERLLGEHEAMLELAKAEVADPEGSSGASVWVEHNAKMVEGLTKTIAVHDDAAIADGTIVQV